MQRLGQQLVDSSLLLKGQDFPRYNQLMVHPVVSAANAGRQQAQLGHLLCGGQKEALGVLAWYGAHEVNVSQTAATRSLTVCEGAAAIMLPTPGQREFLNSVREPVCSSSHLAALWQCCPGQATLLLRSMAQAAAPAIRELGYSLLRPDRHPGQRDTLPTRQAVCLTLTCTVCQLIFSMHGCQRTVAALLKATC